MTVACRDATYKILYHSLLSHSRSTPLYCRLQDVTTGPPVALLAKYWCKKYLSCFYSGCNIFRFPILAKLVLPFRLDWVTNILIFVYIILVGLFHIFSRVLIGVRVSNICRTALTFAFIPLVWYQNQYKVLPILKFLNTFLFFFGHTTLNRDLIYSATEVTVKCLFQFYSKNLEENMIIPTSEIENKQLNQPENPQDFFWIFLPHWFISSTTKQKIKLVLRTISARNSLLVF